MRTIVSYGARYTMREQARRAMRTSASRDQTTNLEETTTMENSSRPKNPEDWAARSIELGGGPRMIWKRVKHSGWTLERAWNTPPMSRIVKCRMGAKASPWSRWRGDPAADTRRGHG